MLVAARDLWTGDTVLRHAGVIVALKYEPSQDGPDRVQVELANAIEVRGIGEFPIEFVENRIFHYNAAEQVEVVRDRPLPNGMHMTQFDMHGKCHGRAHPALEQRLRSEGKMA